MIKIESFSRSVSGIPIEVTRLGVNGVFQQFGAIVTKVLKVASSLILSQLFFFSTSVWISFA